MTLNNIKVSELNQYDWVSVIIENNGGLRTILGEVVYCTSPFDSDEIKASVELTDGTMILISDDNDFRKLDKPFKRKIIMNEQGLSQDKATKKIIKVNNTKYLKSITEQIFGYSIELTDDINECEVFNFDENIEIELKATGGKAIKLFNIEE